MNQNSLDFFDPECNLGFLFISKSQEQS